MRTYLMYLKLRSLKNNLSFKKHIKISPYDPKKFFRDKWHTQILMSFGKKMFSYFVGLKGQALTQKSTN